MVVILTEAGKQQGYGHLIRCLAIAQGFQKRGIRSIFYLRGNSDAGEILKEYSWRSVDWLKDPVDTKNEIVILDSYHAEEEFCKKVYKEAKVALFIDDYNRIPYPGGLVLNSFIGAHEIDYPDNPNIAYILGPKYHPLRREFWRVAKKVIRKNIRKVLVTFGGSDSTNEIPRVLGILTRQYPDLEKHIIIGRGFSNIDEIKAGADKKTVLIYYPNAEKMKQEMLEADICISAGGQTTYELARVGTPTIGICLAENQRMGLERWRKEKFIEYAGWYNDRDLVEKISNCLNSIQQYSKRMDFSRYGKSCVDGRGAERLTQIVLKKIITQNRENGTLLKFRNATKDDCCDVWAWRNHPEVRKACYCTKPVLYKEHQKWFSNKIADSNVDFFIAEDGNEKKIGQVRFEKDGTNIACINVNLNPDFFGNGLGSKMIMNATKYFMSKRSEIKCVKAEILDSNIVSQIAFKKAGYRFHKCTILKGRKTSVFISSKLNKNEV